MNTSVTWRILRAAGGAWIIYCFYHYNQVRHGTAGTGIEVEVIEKGLRTRTNLVYESEFLAKVGASVNGT